MNQHLNQLFHMHHITKNDIFYVSYAEGDHLNDKTMYYCTYDDFLEITKNIKWGYDLKWPHDLKIVGSYFWVHFDREFVLTLYPTKPQKYKKPNNIVNLV
jgi:hypothetical protein